MNLSLQPRTVYLTMEWEYIPSPPPPSFDVIIPVWLDSRGNCFESSLEETGVLPNIPAFNSTMKPPGYVVPFDDGDLTLLVPHIHDGNTAQDIFMNGKLICRSVPGYGETEAFVTHEGMYGHGSEEDEEAHSHAPHRRQGHDHDHESSGHIYHVSSITQCTDVGKIPKGSQFTLKSYYNMTEHRAMAGHNGKEEEIMAIQFLHFARPMEAAIKDILAQGQPDLQSFLDLVNGVGA